MKYLHKQNFYVVILSCVTVIPDTPESTPLTQLTSSSTSLPRLPGSISSAPNLKYNIPETPPSTKSTRKSHAASKLNENSLSKQIFSKSAAKKPQEPASSSTKGNIFNVKTTKAHGQSGSGIFSKNGATTKGHSVPSLRGGTSTSSNVLKPSTAQGNKPQGISSNIVRGRTGHSLLADIEMSNDDDDDSEYLTIPETQFPPADFDLSIPETQFPSPKLYCKPQEKNTTAQFGNTKLKSMTLNSNDARKCSPALNRSLITNQKSVSEVKGHGNITGSGSKRRNMFSCKKIEQPGKEDDKTPLQSRLYGGSTSSERKILTAKRTGNKLSRTHRKLGGTGLSKPKLNSSLNQEKGVCLDQMDLDLLQDCLAENAVVVAPQKALKIKKVKRKSCKVSPVATRKKDIPGFDDDDVDCSILEEMIDNLPGQEKDEQSITDPDADVFKPSKINLKYPSLALKENKNKLSLIKNGSKKRSPCRGNSPFAKRVPGNNMGDSVVAQQPGAHVKSLFQDQKDDSNPVDAMSDSNDLPKGEGIVSEAEMPVDDNDMNYTNDRIEIIEDDSQPFTMVRNDKDSSGITKDECNDVEPESVSAALLEKKTPNKLGYSPWKVQPNSAAVAESPGGAGTDALWGDLNESFLLAAADMEALEEMEADALCQVCFIVTCLLASES